MDLFGFALLRMWVLDVRDHRAFGWFPLVKSSWTFSFLLRILFGERCSSTSGSPRRTSSHFCSTDDVTIPMLPPFFWRPAASSAPVLVGDLAPLPVTRGGRRLTSVLQEELQARGSGSIPLSLPPTLVFEIWSGHDVSGVVLGPSARLWMSLGPSARLWTSLGPSARLWAMLGTSTWLWMLLGCRVPCFPQLPHLKNTAVEYSVSTIVIPRTGT
ncbi:uncharacterized protein LOC113661250 [Tachysurus fulvidraco]|uniref:uncharacterized protein LOC113661250 n=1 Tax=Tachysurus fulvidraco TaxID=1234273 RepID=UPI001FEF8D5C|nr:uncharacterized protein LOC113661250 [Tachysurus fulvidraco]